MVETVRFHHSHPVILLQTPETLRLLISIIIILEHCYKPHNTWTIYFYNDHPEVLLGTH